jgi:nucleoporin NDC1
MASHPPSVVVKAEIAAAALHEKEQQIQKLVLDAPSKWKERVYTQAIHYSPGFVRRATARAGEWWRRERIHRVVDISLPNRKMDGLAIDSES